MPYISGERNLKIRKRFQKKFPKFVTLLLNADAQTELVADFDVLRGGGGLVNVITTTVVMVMTTFGNVNLHRGGGHWRGGGQICRAALRSLSIQRGHARKGKNRKRRYFSEFYFFSNSLRLISLTTVYSSQHHHHHQQQVFFSSHKTRNQQQTTAVLSFPLLSFLFFLNLKLFCLITANKAAAAAAVQCNNSPPQKDDHHRSGSRTFSLISVCQNDRGNYNQLKKKKMHARKKTREDDRLSE